MTPRSSTTIKYLNDDEIRRLFAVISNIRDRAIFRLGYHRGLRASEVAMLHMEDFRRETGRLFVHRAKRGISGEFLLTDVELRALRAWLRERGTHPGPLFPSRLGTAISQPMLDKLMKRYCLMAGIPRAKAHFHTLRHSCATSLIDRGEHILAVKDWLGHKSINSTAVYAQITSKARDTVAARQKGWE